MGTRRASEGGKNLALEFARVLGGNGLTIVSGLAFGIDASAHQGALADGGATIAVLPGGLDRIYPRTNHGLGERIGETGLLVSEYPLGAAPLPYRFLERNRLISGLCQGVLIIEAPTRSGSLATARFALEQNRQVFVVPGPARHPNFAGSHELIRSGAELVTEPGQILESLGFAPILKAGTAGDLPPAAALILETLRPAGQVRSIDKIAELTNLRIQSVSQALTFLLLTERIREEGEGYVLK